MRMAATQNQVKLNRAGIDAQTKIYAVLGFPISHSLSPLIQNMALQACGINAVYLAMEVRPTDLKSAVTGLRAIHVAGFNITVPHKQTVIPFLDEISEEARQVGAVNTVKNIEGCLWGTTTDAQGAIESLSEEGIPLTGQSIVIVGAGGAARSLAFGLAGRARIKSLTVLARRKNQWGVLIKDIKRYYPSLPIQGETLSEEILKEILPETDLLIQTTSLGMIPHEGETLIPKDLLQRNLTVFDIVYNPLQTRLLKEASERGCRTVNGLGMLVHQGAAAFEIWHGQKAAVREMKKILLNQPPITISATQGGIN